MQLKCLFSTAKIFYLFHHGDKSCISRSSKVYEETNFFNSELEEKKKHLNFDFKNIQFFLAFSE